jgi:hypothetical protein
MRNLLLLLISTAITSLGVLSLNAAGNSSSKIIGDLTKVVSIDAQETKSNLLLESYLTVGFEIFNCEDVNLSKEITISNTTLNFCAYDACKKHITFYDFYYKINKILYTKEVVLLNHNLHKIQPISNKKSHHLLQINMEQETIYAELDLKEIPVYKLN